MFRNFCFNMTLDWKGKKVKKLVSGRQHFTLTGEKSYRYWIPSGILDQIPDWNFSRSRQYYSILHPFFSIMQESIWNQPSNREEKREGVGIGIVLPPCPPRCPDQNPPDTLIQFISQLTPVSHLSVSATQKGKWGGELRSCSVWGIVLCGRGDERGMVLHGENEGGGNICIPIRERMAFGDAESNTSFRL